MRLLPLALLLLAGCDTITGTSSEAVALMDRLDGVWTRTVTTERITADGAVIAEGSPRTDAYEVGRQIRCNRITLDSVADTDRVSVAFDPTNTAVPRDCAIITTDGTASRLIFIGDAGSLVEDLVATIEEDSRERQVWAFYAFDGGETVRTLWTLTR
ncbi:MAG: hypothetical protein AAF845_01985 [Bacteroidota bacterium]